MPRKKAVKDENVNVANEVANEVLTTEETMQNEIEPEDIQLHENVVDENLVTDEPSAEETSAETSLSEDLLVDNLLEGSSSEEISATDNPSAENPTTDADSVSVHHKQKLGVLKVNLDEEESQDDEFETQWNEIVTFYRTRRLVPVTITGIEKTQLAGHVVVTYYKNQRILVPLTEMLIFLSDEPNTDYSQFERLERICSTMLGAEIDVIIKGIDKKTESVVASRRDAMMRKREKFYLTPLSDGLPHIREGRVVEARIIGVTQLVARLEVFGVETTLGASELSWDWLPNVSDKFSVGDRLNVLIKEIRGDKADNLKIIADAKSITVNTSMENISKCTVQNRYVGVITNVRNGIAYLRLKVGVNAIAHTNYDRHTPAKGDMVSFVITRINTEYGNVAGIITKIIKQSI